MPIGILVRKERLPQPRSDEFSELYFAIQILVDLLEKFVGYACVNDFDGFIQKRFELLLVDHAVVVCVHFYKCLPGAILDLIGQIQHADPI